MEIGNSNIMKFTGSIHLFIFRHLSLVLDSFTAANIYYFSPPDQHYTSAFDIIIHIETFFSLYGGLKRGAMG